MRQVLSNIKLEGLKYYCCEKGNRLRDGGEFPMTEIGLICLLKRDAVRVLTFLLLT